MPTPENFWNKAAAKYSRRPIKDMAAYEATLERVRAHLRPTDAVLELGCGTGGTALALAPSAGHVTGVDISSEMIRIATEKGEGAANVSFEKADLESGALGDTRYDVVMAFNLLHLIEDLPGALRRIHEHVAPGGLFISKTPCLSHFGLLVKIMIPVMRAVGRAPFVGYLKTDEVEAMIRATGFEIVETGDYPASSHSRFVVAKRTDPA
ncbi:MAG: class I SAM-dependent methyltransferase [Pseudomonadota bacterium]